jgi:predicted membrane protein (TIGR00267 family)
MSGGDRISRRYFVMNSFDGVVTVLGVIVGAMATKIIDPAVIFGIGLGTSISMFISGFSGTFIAEKAERDIDIQKLKRAMLVKSLDNTIYAKVYRVTVIWVSLVDAFSPLISGMIALMPQLLAMWGFIDPLIAIYLSIVIILVYLFILGSYLSKITNRNIIVGGVVLLLVGILTTVLIVLILNFMG